MAGCERAAVPCGQCAECRENYRRSWLFRLRVELESLSRLGWQIGFFTLTYNDENLPHFPAEAFKDSQKYKSVACFSYNHVSRFIKGLRKWLWKKYKLAKDDRLRYIICSEYGERGRRPHYHGIVCFPPQVNAESVYNWIRDNWTYGFICPAKFLGGRDAKGNEHKPFVCESVIAAACYGAKYVCKDTAFIDDTSDIEFDRKSRAYKYGKPFHVQSRSLGLSLIEKMTDSEKLRLLIDGHSFVGMKTLMSCPVYLKNKILFDNKYLLDKNGKRVVLRNPTEFFKQHKQEIFDKKKSIVLRLFQQVQCVGFWQARGVQPELAEALSNKYALLIGSNFNELAEFHTALYGIPSYWAFSDIPLVDVWFNRYLEFPRIGKVPYNSRKMSDREYLENELFTDINYYCETNMIASHDVEVRDVSEYWKCHIIEKRYKLNTKKGGI